MPRVFAYWRNDLGIVYISPKHKVSTENIDMGQRNQIRGQREREKQAAAWRRNST